MVNFYNNYSQPNTNYSLQKENLLLGANLYNFLPHIPYREYNSIHKSCLLNQSLADIEESMTELIDDIQCNININDIKFNSKIFCTFHYASYRLVCPYLIRNNIDIALVVADKPYKEQSEKYYKQIDNIKKYYNVNSHFEVINAQSENSFKRMINILKNGGNLIFYLDGNTGINEKISNLQIIDFLDHKFYSRKGIPILSYLTKSDIVPIIMDRMESLDKHSITFYENIPALKSKNEDDIKSTLNKIYYNLELLINNNPQYWECWFYLNRYYLNYNLIKDFYPNNSSKKYKYNKERFAIVYIKNNHYLFDRLNAKFIPVNKGFSEDFINDNIKIDNDKQRILINKNIIT